MSPPGVRGPGGSPDPVELAQELVRIPSVNPGLETGGAGEEELARSVASWLDGWGFEARTEEVAPGRYNVVAAHPGGDREPRGPTLLLNGHLDTVGVDGMVVPPFAGEIRDGRLVGRGACDMKGGVASILAAACVLAGEGHDGRLLVALTADEEHASVGMQSLVASGIRADAAVVCEPTSLAVMPAHKGFVWLRARFNGRAAHGSRPDEGVDAIRHAGLYLAALEALHARLREETPHPLLGRPTFHAGTIEGGSAASVYPARCDLVLERRTMPGETEEEVLDAFRRVLGTLAQREPRMDAVIESTLARPGTEVASDAPLVRSLLAAAEEEGAEAVVEGMTAWVDAAFLNEAGIPAVCFGPGSIARAHAADESVPVAELRVCARVLTRFAAGFLSGGSPASGAVSPSS